MARSCPIANAPPPLRLEATIFAPGPQRHVHHVLRFDWRSLNERWAFTVRIEDVLAQGYAVHLAPAPLRAERLLAKFPH